MAKHKKKSIVPMFILSVALLFVGFVVLNWQQPCANSISCIKDLTGALVQDQEATFLGHKINVPSYIAQNIVPKQVLGESTVEKHIYIDLAIQKLYAYEGEKLAYSFPVSTGKWGKTPTGDFKIWIKLIHTRMSGGSGADYYNLPNVPYTMFFYNDEVAKSKGFSIHGAYWHNNFGYTMSHGCINMRPEDAAIIYDWVTPATDGNVTRATDADPGTPITIYGESPS